MRKIFKVLIVLISLFSLSGCFNYKEINEYAIVSGISIDINEDDPSKYDVGIQIMNAKKEEESENSLITIYKTEGNTIYEAFERIMLDSPKELYLGHNEVVVISEELLKSKDPLNYLDYFLRDSEVEKDSLVMVSKDDKAYNVLKIITPLETIPSRNLKSTLSVADNFSGTLTMVTIDEFIANLSMKGEEAIIPSIMIKGEVKDGEKMENISESDPKTKLKFGTLGYFKDNKLVGYLTSDESTGYNFLAQTPKETYVNVKCDNKNYATIRVTSSKLNEELFFKNKKPFVSIESKVNADLLEYNCTADFLKSEKYIKELENKAAKKIKKLMEKATDKLYKEEKSDVLRYGSKFYGEKYKEMKMLDYKQDEIVNDVTFNFKTSVNINSTNLSIKSIRKESKNE